MMPVARRCLEGAQSAGRRLRKQFASSLGAIRKQPTIRAHGACALRRLPTWIRTQSMAGSQAPELTFQSPSPRQGRDQLHVGPAYHHESAMRSKIIGTTLTMRTSGKPCGRIQLQPRSNYYSLAQNEQPTLSTVKNVQSHVSTTNWCHTFASCMPDARAHHFTALHRGQEAACDPWLS